jgi:putative oxidoreductase
MSPLATLTRLNGCAAAALAPLQSAFLLALRVYVAWQFLKSGWLKLQDWESTLFLFQEEYHVPLLSPTLAAALGTAGELVFPVLLIAGLLTRFAALGLSAVNVLAVVAYAHVLLGEGFEAALGQHWLWGSMLATVLVFGGGRLSLDALLAGRGGAGHGGVDRGAAVSVGAAG